VYKTVETVTGETERNIWNLLFLKK